MIFTPKQRTDYGDSHKLGLLIKGPVFILLKSKALSLYPMYVASETCNSDLVLKKMQEEGKDIASN